MSAFRRLRFAALAGGVIFAAWGLLESAIQLRPVPWWPAVTTRAAQAAGIYALVGAVLVAAWGATALRLDPRTFRARAFGVGGLLTAYVFLGFHINQAFFPSSTSPLSLLFSATWTGLLIWLLLRLRSGGAAGTDTGAGLDRVLHVAVAGVLAVVVAALVLPGLWTQ